MERLEDLVQRIVAEAAAKPPVRMSDDDFNATMRTLYEAQQDWRAREFGTDPGQLHVPFKFVAWDATRPESGSTFERPAYTDPNGRRR